MARTKKSEEIQVREEDSNLGEYGSFDLEAAENELDDLNRSQSQFLKLAVGNNVVRLLPPPLGRNTPFVVVWQHFIKLPGATAPVVFNCPRMMARKTCPACAKAEKLGNSRNSADRDAAREFWATKRIFASVIDRTDEEAGPKILGFGKSIYEALLALRTDSTAGGDYTNPLKGFDINIKRTGTGLETRYDVLSARRNSALGDMEWIGMAPDLRELARVPTADEIREMGRRAKGGEDETPRLPEKTVQDELESLDDWSSGGDSDDDEIPF